MAGANRIKDFPSASLPLKATDFFAVDSGQDGCRKVAASTMSRVLFKFDPALGTTQFDTPIIEDTGSAAAAVPSVSVVPGTNDPNPSVLKLIATGQIDNGFKAAIFLPVKAAELVLGAGRRYRARIVVGYRDTTSGKVHRSLGVGFLGGLTGSDWFVHHVGPHDTETAAAASANSQTRHYRVDGNVAAPNNVRVSASTPAGVKPVVGGYELEVDFAGKDGSPPEWRFALRGIGDESAVGLRRGQGDWAMAAHPAGWNALALGRVGISLIVDATAAHIVNPYYEIEEFTVFKHPMDE